MEFYNLDKKEVVYNSEIEGDYYKYFLGGKVEVTSTKRRHKNLILSNSLSTESKEDRMMVRYHPSNIVYFDRDFIDTDAKLASCFIDGDSSRVYIGDYGKYPIKVGVLAFSGILSANRMVESQRTILINSQMASTGLEDKVRLLSFGVLGSDLFGLYYIPKERGIAISSDTGSKLAYSVKTWNLHDYSTWHKNTVGDWFEGTQIKEVD